MASVMRFGRIAATFPKLITKTVKCQARLPILSSRLLCSKSGETKKIAIEQYDKSLDPAVVKRFEDTSDSNPENWVSFGVDHYDKDKDEVGWHLIMFSSISICIVGVTFVLIYQPNSGMKVWAHREAYLQLAHREKLGLPLINPDYIDRDKMTLPSEEELGDAPVLP